MDDNERFFDPDFFDWDDWNAEDWEVWHAENDAEERWYCPPERWEP